MNSLMTIMKCIIPGYYIIFSSFAFITSISLPPGFDPDGFILWHFFRLQTGHAKPLLRAVKCFP